MLWENSDDSIRGDSTSILRPYTYAIDGLANANLLFIVHIMPVLPRVG